jgi:hypothetical protein
MIKTSHLLTAARSSKKSPSVEEESYRMAKELASIVQNYIPNASVKCVYFYLPTLNIDIGPTRLRYTVAMTPLMEDGQPPCLSVRSYTSQVPFFYEEINGVPTNEQLNSLAKSLVKSVKAAISNNSNNPN